jgi:DNA-binding transcriptional LysR family regulator
VRALSVPSPEVVAGAVAELVVLEGPEVKAGSLVPLLRGYRMEPVEVHAIFPGGRRPSAKVRALVDFLIQEFK